MLLKKGAQKNIKNNYGDTPKGLVAGTFASKKDVYEMLEKMLAPMGLKLDYVYIQKTRPIILNMLK
jgi:uncharacterized protein